MSVTKMIVAIVVAFFICWTFIQYEHGASHSKCVAQQAQAGTNNFEEC